MDKEQFKSNLFQTIQEAVNELKNKTILFTITPIKEENAKYNSIDDFARLWILTEKNLSKQFTLDEVVDLLALPNYKYPLWIKVILSERTNENIIFELRISMRFRTPTQLKHSEAGYLPFVYEFK
ncbi:hypothetical protein [Flavobacterium sp. KACC 22763]|uniref:hypothetical protein n=1 Tax=Flavobacterium sp. KACC 22763 TaxID=3025668 RepID=UPI002366A249|nr:hypothetical protein [Flavobacterium sp. KACC 22763]WDF66301.1 hypothetical protein PQ463_09045 [Flavobacterium sp. KACC 22763]